MAIYEPLQQELTSQTQDGGNVVSNDKHNGIDHLATTLPPPKPLKSSTKSRRRQLYLYGRGTVIMVFLVLVPMLLYSPAVLSYTPGAYTKAIDICAPKVNFPSFFEPDMLMGEFTLAQAKAIDFGWNAVIGRGAQALMASGSYGIVMQGLTRIAEMTPVRYDLFVALVFRPNSITSTLSLIQSILKSKGWRSKFAIGWLLYSLALMATIPTFFDASSGYAIANGLVLYSGDSINGTYYGPFEDLPSNFRSTGGQNSPVYTCLPDSSYQWGFVSGWIFIIYPMYSIWVFGMYVLWVDAQHNSTLTRQGWRSGEWKAIVDLAGAINQELGPDSNGYSNKELRGILKNRPPLMYDVQSDDNGLHRVLLTSHQQSISTHHLS